jgi:peptidoglycan/xylan/chitin deacetylase (PgdA/CDA1 family)
MTSPEDFRLRRRERARHLRRRRRAAALIAVALVAIAAAIALASSGGSSRPGPPSTQTSAGSQHARSRQPLPGTETAGDHRAPREPVPILMYHVIGYAKASTPNAELWVSPSTFAAQMRGLARAGYHGITLQRAYDAWHRHAELPSKPIVVSFDDGYYGQYRNARPTLHRLGWPGVLNLKLGNLADMGGARNIKRMMAEGWEIDDHTITHPDLTTVSDQQLTYEIATSRKRFRRLFGSPANFFCYPAGRFDARVVAEVRRAGYLGATTTQFGYARPRDRFTLARVRVNRSDGVAGVLRNVRTLGAHPDAAPVAQGGE